ncbi:MAG: tRNA pseudouridine(38-40) synthase TruA [Bacteroidales bacterium]|nr:tRNA pseudouridine(38-40) synthase TruA [Bacteroidales bacterium]
MRYFIELAYKGTHFHGWQVQPGAITVQESIEKALSTKLRTTIRLTGAGRTDAGVHASFFVAHFDTDAQFNPSVVILGLNHLVGQDIVIYKIYSVKADLHARFDAKSRCYEYRISRIKNPFYKETTTLLTRTLDIDLMREASAILFNHQDFTSFSKLHTDTKTNNCKIMQAEWIENGQLLIFKIKADRFLRNMVRAIVGTLLDVGEKKITPEEFERIIIAKNRSLAGQSAPPEGLFLTNIEY